MPPCKGKLSNGKPCTKILEDGKTFCRWHDLEDESWRDFYAHFEKSTPDEKTKFVLALIEDHPEHRLVLPERDGWKADLLGIDLDKEIISKRREQLGIDELGWWSKEENGFNLDRASLQGANLMSSNLQGTSLRQANFQQAFLSFTNLRNADLTEANLEDAYLLDASLQGAKLSSANLRNAHLSGAKLQGAFLLYADLQNADLSNSDLQDAILMGANLQGAKLYKANLQGAKLQQAQLQGVDMSSVECMSNIRLGKAWLNQTRIIQKLLGDKIFEDHNKDFASARLIYLALKQNFDDLGDYEASSWAYRRERRMEKREALQQKKYLKFISDSIVELLCDYGESGGRVIACMAIMLLIAEPLTLSLFGGFRWDTALANQYYALSSLWCKFWFSYRLHILYSLGGVGASSFSGLQPANLTVELASSLFSIIGVFLVGLLGFVAGNRIRRS